MNKCLEAESHPGCGKVSPKVDRQTVVCRSRIWAKKILRAFGPKDCTLVHLVLWRSIRYYHVPIDHTSSGRSSDLRINLLSAPSHFACAKQWLYRISSPFTAAGPFPYFTGFPFKPCGTWCL